MGYCSIPSGCRLWGHVKTGFGDPEVYHLATEEELGVVGMLEIGVFGLERNRDRKVGN